MITDSTILITGGAGFIGSELATVLAPHNRIIIFDNFSRDALQHKAVANHPNLRIIRGDICDFAAVREAVKGVDYIIHCAGVAGIQTVCRSPTNTMRVNMLGSYNLLEATAQEGGIRRVVCFSTSEVFGGMAFSSKEADRSVIGAAGEARWTYAVSKLAEEHLAIAYWKEKKLPTTVIRPFNIYGPTQVGEGALKIFVQQALRNEPITIYGDGTQVRAWCYVDDMVRATLLCMENDKAIGESFNIGNARSVETIYGLANVVIRVLKSESEIKYLPASSVDIDLRIPCVDKAEHVLGFKAKVYLEEGILATADYYRKQMQQTPEDPKQ